MNPKIDASLRAIRRAQIAGRISFLGIFASFLVLALADPMPTFGTFVRVVLIASFVVYAVSLAYVRLRKCPACGNYFATSTGRIGGSFFDLTAEACRSCGTPVRKH